MIKIGSMDTAPSARIMQEVLAKVAQEAFSEDLLKCLAAYRAEREGLGRLSHEQQAELLDKYGLMEFYLKLMFQSMNHAKLVLSALLVANRFFSITFLHDDRHIKMLCFYFIPMY